MAAQAPRWVVVLIAMLAMGAIRVQAQAAAESALTTSAMGTLGAQIGSAIGGATKQTSQTVVKSVPQQTTSKNAAKPKAASAQGGQHAATGPASKSAMSAVHVDSTPAGALVSVDNAPAGRTPISLTLSKGIHVISVTQEGLTAWQETILLTGGEKLSLNPTLRDPKSTHPLFTVQR